MSTPPPLHTQHLLGEFRKESGIDLSGDTLAMQRLREAAEKVGVPCVAPRFRRSACCVLLWHLPVFFLPLMSPLKTYLIMSRSNGWVAGGLPCHVVLYDAVGKRERECVCVLSVL